MALGEYNSGSLRQNQFRVSPSGVNNLIYNLPYWLKVNVLKYKYNDNLDSLDLGSCFHHMVEEYYDGKDIANVVNECTTWLESKGHSDIWTMEEQLTKMFDVWVNEFIKEYPNKPEVEKWVEFEPNDVIKISGTVDAIFNEDTVIDWKTSGTRKKSLDSYKNQLYMYAWLLNKNGYDIKHIGVCVIKKPAMGKNGLGSSAVDILIEPIDSKYMSELIEKVKQGVKEAQEAINEPIVMKWLDSIDIPNPFNRSAF